MLPYYISIFSLFILGCNYNTNKNQDIYVEEFNTEKQKTHFYNLIMFDLTNWT